MERRTFHRCHLEYSALFSVKTPALFLCAPRPPLASFYSIKISIKIFERERRAYAKLNITEAAGETNPKTCVTTWYAKLDHQLVFTIYATFIVRYSTRLIYERY